MLTANLITKVDDCDIEESIENLKFIDSRSYEVSFDVWKKNADGKESFVHDWTSLMGNDKKTLLFHLPEKMISWGLKLLTIS